MIIGDGVDTTDGTIPIGALDGITLIGDGVAITIGAGIVLGDGTVGDGAAIMAGAILTGVVMHMAMDLEDITVIGATEVRIMEDTTTGDMPSIEAEGDIPTL